MSESEQTKRILDEINQIGCNRNYIGGMSQPECFARGDADHIAEVIVQCARAFAGGFDTLTAELADEQGFTAHLGSKIVEFENRIHALEAKVQLPPKDHVICDDGAVRPLVLDGTGAWVIDYRATKPAPPPEDAGCTCIDIGCPIHDPEKAAPTPSDDGLAERMAEKMIRTADGDDTLLLINNHRPSTSATIRANHSCEFAVKLLRNFITSACRDYFDQRTAALRDAQKPQPSAADGDEEWIETQIDGTDLSVEESMRNAIERGEARARFESSAKIKELEDRLAEAVKVVDAARSALPVVNKGAHGFGEYERRESVLRGAIHRFDELSRSTPTEKGGT